MKRDEGSAESVITTIELTAEPEGVPGLFRLLQNGFGVQADPGRSIWEFLCGDLGLEPQYVEERILSIMLDGKPVDDLPAAVLREGAILALSSGMPGLVGVTLKRGSFLASFREGITYRAKDEQRETTAAPAGHVTFSVKLFNLMIRELGPRFLERGILLSTTDGGEVIQAWARNAGIGETILVNGDPIGPDEFRNDRLPAAKQILLRCTVGRDV